MEHLAYSSSSSEEEEEDKEESNCPSSELPPPPETLTLYSQNYILNKGMRASYSYIPWNPSAVAKRRVKVLSQNVLNQVFKVRPELKDRYHWHFMGDKSTKVDGRYSVTNLNNLEGFHITVQNNIHGDPSTIAACTAALKNSVENLIVPYSLIGYDKYELQRANALTSIFDFKEPKKVPHYINLKFEKKISLFFNPSSNNMFASLKLVKDGDQGKFLDELDMRYRLIRKQFKLNPAPKFNYHMTLCVGESKGYRLGDEVEPPRKKQNFGKPKPIKKKQEPHEISTEQEIEGLDDLLDFEISVKELIIHIMGGTEVKVNFNIEDSLIKGELLNMEKLSEKSKSKNKIPNVENSNKINDATTADKVLKISKPKSDMSTKKRRIRGGRLV